MLKFKPLAPSTILSSTAWIIHILSLHCHGNIAARCSVYNAMEKSCSQMFNLQSYGKPQLDVLVYAMEKLHPDV